MVKLAFKVTSLFLFECTPAPASNAMVRCFLAAPLHRRNSMRRSAGGLPR